MSHESLGEARVPGHKSLSLGVCMACYRVSRETSVAKAERGREGSEVRGHRVLEVRGGS